MKSQKGITLVALGITIIILGILAGFSIASLFGDNGLIVSTRESKENMELTQKEEKEKVNQLYEQITGYDAQLNSDVGSVTEVLENEILTLQNKYDDMEEEYSAFKTAIAEAITEKGIETQSTDSSTIMAENIRSISGFSSIMDYIYVSDTGGTTAKYKLYHIDSDTITDYEKSYTAPSYSDELLSSVTYSYPSYKFTLAVDCYVNDVAYVAGSVIELTFTDSSTKLFIRAQNT